jgi:hypothetical protein
MICIKCIKGISKIQQILYSEMKLDDKILLAKVICFALWIKLFINFDKLLLVKFSIRTITNKTLISKEINEESIIDITNRMPFANF